MLRFEITPTQQRSYETVLFRYTPRNSANLHL